MFSKPHFAVSVEEMFIKIICNSSSKLDFSQHIPHSIPRHSLKNTNVVDTDNGKNVRIKKPDKFVDSDPFVVALTHAIDYLQVRSLTINI